MRTPCNEVFNLNTVKMDSINSGSKVMVDEADQFYQSGEIHS